MAETKQPAFALTWGGAMTGLDIVPDGHERLWVYLGLWMATQGQRGSLELGPVEKLRLAEQAHLTPVEMESRLPQLPRVSVVVTEDGTLHIHWKNFGMEGVAEAPKEKKAPEEKLPVNELKQHYIATYKALFGAEPVMSFARDGAAAKTLLKAYGLEEAKKLVAEFLSRPPRFYREHRLYNLYNVPNAANQIIARRKEEEL